MYIDYLPPDTPTPAAAVAQRDLPPGERGPGRFPLSSRLVVAHGASYLLAVAAYQIVDFTSRRGTYYPLEMEVAVGAGLFCAQVVLAGMAGALSRWTELNVGLTLACYFFWAIVLSVNSQSLEPFGAALFGGSLVFFFVMLVLLLFRLTFPRQELTPAPDRSPLPPWQFSLKQMFVVTGGLACFLGAQRSGIWWQPPSPDAMLEMFRVCATTVVGVVLVIGTLGGLAFLLMVLPVWLTLRVSWPLLGVLGYTTLLTALAAASFLSAGGSVYFSVLIFAATYALAVTGTLWILRRAGYRLVSAPSEASTS